MFELIAGKVDRPFNERRVAPAAVSMSAYALAIAIGIFAAFFSIGEELPEVPTLMAYVAEIPAPAPPPPPPAPPAARQPQPRPVPKPPEPAGQFVAPVEAPPEITPETGVVSDVAEGVPGGVEGGVPGGVVGGVVGGIVSAPPPPPPPAAPVRVGGDIREPELVYKVDPVYPAIAVVAKVTGLVILEALVDEQGAVQDVKVLRSRAMLDEAAMEAVRQWRYRPLVLNGQPQSFILTVVVTFSFK